MVQLAQLNIAQMRTPFEDPSIQDFVVLWWVPAGHRPTEQEAGEKLELLRSQGPSPDAFTFRESFDPPA